MAELKQRIGHRGYVSSREFGGLRIPVPLQALAMRDYCARKNLFYKLHANENSFPHSYTVLEGLIRNLSSFQGLLMTSMFMLPHRPERRARIYETIFRQGADLHFVLEDMVIASLADVEPVEEILSIYQTLKHCPHTIPQDCSAAP
jgi:sporadic carbohydrate cluster protein (TIGR04323 family)